MRSMFKSLLYLPVYTSKRCTTSRARNVKHLIHLLTLLCFKFFYEHRNSTGVGSIQKYIFTSSRALYINYLNVKKKIFFHIRYCNNNIRLEVRARVQQVDGSRLSKMKRSREGRAALPGQVAHALTDVARTFLRRISRRVRASESQLRLHQRVSRRGSHILCTL